MATLENNTIGSNTSPYILNGAILNISQNVRTVRLENSTIDEEFSIDNFELVGKNLQFLICVLYIVTATLALFGNLISMIVLYRGKRSPRDVRISLINLSFSDVMMSIFSIPFTYTDFIMGRWMFAPSLCPLVQSIQLVCVFVSVYILVIIGIDRYLAITKPFNINFWSKSFASVAIFVIWLCGGALGLVIWFYSKAEPFKVNNDIYYDCRETWSFKFQEQFYTVALFLVVFAIPMSSLLFLYGSICFRIWYHFAPGNADAARDNAQYQNKKKVINMLITICVLFAIFWLPSHLFHLFRVFDEEALLSFIGNDASSPRYLTIVILSHWLSMAHSMVNPFVYIFYSDNFKADVKYLMKGVVCLNKEKKIDRHRRLAWFTPRNGENVSCNIEILNLTKEPPLNYQSDNGKNLLS